MNCRVRSIAHSSVFSPPSIIPVALSQRVPHLARFQSTSSTNDEPATESLHPRWLSDLKTRIGKCINFGINSEQLGVANDILAEVNAHWRDMLAGSEGFLTGTNRWGLYRHQVAWGEMV